LHAGHGGQARGGHEASGEEEGMLFGKRGLERRFDDRKAWLVSGVDRDHGLV
jgi:hypothetical protein